MTAQALTAEEWRRAHGDLQADVSGHVFWGDNVFQMDQDARAIDLCDHEGAPRRPAIAALALAGQSFGFAWSDVDNLKQVAMDLGYTEGSYLDDICERIAALLPPRVP